MRPHSPQMPFEIVSIDILGPYRETARHNQYVIIAEDVFTKWIEAAAVPVANVNTIIQFLQTEIFARYGYPRTIISDNAKIFQADRYIQLCQSHGITIYYSPVYHQRSNPVERRVQEFKKVMRSMLFTQHHRKNWDKHLPRTLQVLRGRRNEATGMSPSEALLGYQFPREGEWEIPEYLEERSRRITRQTRLENIRRRQLEFQQKWYDQQRHPQVIFTEGELVMTREGAPRKGEFGNAWSGPYIILHRLSDEVYEVEKDGAVVRTHVDDLRPAPPGNPDPNEVQVEEPEEPGDPHEATDLEPEHHSEDEAGSQRESGDNDDTGETRDPEHGKDEPKQTESDPEHGEDEPKQTKSNPEHGESKPKQIESYPELRHRPYEDGKPPPPAREVSGPSLYRRGRRVRLVARD